MSEFFDDLTGERLNLNTEERKTFLEIAKTKENNVKYFSLMLYYTGCSLNEPLELMIESIDFKNQTVIIWSLKKKRKIRCRHTPLPEGFLNKIAGAYKLRTKKRIRKSDTKPIYHTTTP